MDIKEFRKQERKKILAIIQLIIMASLYAIPIIIITIIALLCYYFGIHNDITSTKPIVWFIAPLRHFEKKLDNLNRQL